MIPQHPKAATTNLCINCTHHHKPGIFDLCVKPQNALNPVNGQVVSTKCLNERESSMETRCGSVGQHFEPKLAEALGSAFNDWKAGRNFQLDEVKSHGGSQC